MGMGTLIALVVVLMGLFAFAVVKWGRTQSDDDIVHELADTTQGREQDPGADAPQLTDSDPDRRPYEERTYDELYSLASERDINGRSSMNKNQLIRSLREERHG